MTAYVRTTTLDDCLELAPKLRQHDVSEVTAMNPDKTPLEVLTRGLEISEVCFSVVDPEDGCIAIFGVHRYHEVSSVGVPWLLASETLFDKYNRRFVKECKDYVKALTAGFSLLFNFVGTDNDKAKRWLHWLGFRIVEDVYTFNGKKFNQFYLERG